MRTLDKDLIKRELTNLTKKFGEDSKYLKEVKIVFVPPLFHRTYYNFKEKKIYCNIMYCLEEDDAIVHELSHAIVDIKYGGIWENILYRFHEKYKEIYKKIANDVASEMEKMIIEKVKEAKEKLHDLEEEIRRSDTFEEKCLLYARACKDVVKAVNELNMNIAKRFEEIYGKEVGEYVRLHHEIIGIDELVARAVGKQVLEPSLIDHIGLYCFERYFFKGSITVCRIRKLLKEMGYPKVTDMLFYKRVKRARELIEKIC